MSTALICAPTVSHRVVLERDHAHRAGAHAGAATAAAALVEHRVALFVLVDGAERAFHRAALALGAAFETDDGEGQVARARMRGAAERGVLDRLDRLQRGAGGIFHRLHHVHRTAHRAGGVDAGAARFVGEADEVRIGEAVLQLRQIRALAVGQVEDGNRLDLPSAAPTSRRCGQPLVDVHAGVRHLAGGEHHQVGVVDGASGR